MTEREEEERLEWVEHLGKAAEAVCRDMKGILPEETYRHLRACRKDLLLAIRSLIDRQIAKLEQEQERKARRVEVQ